MKPSLRRHVRGISLVELMIGVTLGLFLLAGVASVFTATGQVNRSNENLSRLQESARMAFNLLARDIREAGLNDCGRISRVVNVLQGAAGLSWANWNQGITGYEQGVAAPGLVTGTGVGQRVNAEDAVQIMRGGATGLSVASHDPTAASLKLTNLSTFSDGDVVVVCDFTQASIFQITNTNTANVTIVHNTGGSQSPGNCSKGLGWANPPVCTVNGKPYEYGPNSSVMSFESVLWYIGNNGRPASGGTSLYRIRLRNTAGVVGPVAEEVLEGVTSLQLEYLVGGAATYVNAAAVADWSTVLAVRIHLTLRGLTDEINAAGTGERVQRDYFNVVTIRNRVS